jgi:methyl-accepting chemotaxis protein
MSMENPVRHLSLKAKIGGSIVLLVLAIVVFQLFFFPQQQIRQLRNALESKAISLARFIAYEVSASLEFDDLNTVKGAFQGAARDPDYAYAMLFTKEGKLYYSHHQEKGVIPPSHRRPLETQALTYAQQVLEVSVPVESKSDTLGMLVMGLSTRTLEQQRKEIQQITAAIGFLLLLVGLAIAFFVSSRVTRPILKMTHAFRRMADGDLQQPQVPITSKDETGAMAQAFNEMLATLLQLGQTAKEVAQGNLSLTISAKGDLADEFSNMLAMLRELSQKAMEISGGNLDLDLTAEGDLADAFRKMIHSQRQMVQQIAETSVQLTVAATNFQKNAELQQSGAVAQSNAVERNRKNMDILLESSRRIAQTAQGVLQNAEKTQNNSRLVAHWIEELSAQTAQIGEILTVINDIADKSDLLALNAALEGIKAGEAGRGFSLVAIQMQRFAENVLTSVRGIKDLTDTITQTTQATVKATDESKRLAADATQSARQISAIIEEQKAGTEQISTAMNDVAQIAHETAEGSKMVVASTRELVHLSDQLRTLIGQFKGVASGTLTEEEPGSSPSILQN